MEYRWATVICVCRLELVLMLVLSREHVEELVYSYGVVPDAHMVEFSSKDVLCWQGFLVLTGVEVFWL